MEHISLLPVEFKSKKQYKRRLGISSIALGITAGILLFALTILRILSSIPESELRALKAEQELLRNEINELMPLTTLSEDIKQQKKLVDKAMGGQPDWLKIFALVEAGLPESVTITNMTAEYDEKATILNIQGSAGSHNEVALWMESLKDSGLVMDTGLKYSRVESSVNTDTIRFELNVTVSAENKFKLFEEVKK